jgi:hypothetical protein
MMRLKMKKSETKEIPEEPVVEKAPAVEAEKEKGEISLLGVGGVAIKQPLNAATGKRITPAEIRIQKGILYNYIEKKMLTYFSLSQILQN